MTTTKPRVIGYIPLLYGKEYLKECILSMLPFVDKLYIFYVNKPSQGHTTDIPCPENGMELCDLATSISKKVIWIGNCTCTTEGEHRELIMQYSNGYDLVLTLDADEVIDGRDVEQALDTAYKGYQRYWGIDGFINFWRSFDNVCLDGFRPIRIINLNNTNTDPATVKCRIYHFSCAQSEVISRYKWNVSGHKDELRTNWIDNTLYGDSGTDLHPVAIGLWNAQPFDKTILPELLKQHPNYSKPLI